MGSCIVRPNGSRLTRAAKRMLSWKQQPTLQMIEANTPMPVARRQVQPLVRAQTAYRRTSTVLSVLHDHEVVACGLPSTKVA